MNANIKGSGSTWQMDDFMIHTDQGPKPQVGMVSPPFSIHIDGNGNHVLSHLGSGMQCCVCGRWTDAVSIADDLRTVADWDFEETKGPKMEAACRAVKASGIVDRMKAAAPCKP